MSVSKLACKPIFFVSIDDLSLKALKEGTKANRFPRAFTPGRVQSVLIYLNSMTDY